MRLGAMLNDPGYSNYIKSARWKAKRELVFNATGKYCKACGKANGILNVHHLSYDRLGRERLSDLIVLCKQDHDDLTKEWRAYGRRSGLTLREFTIVFINRRKRKRG